MNISQRQLFLLYYINNGYLAPVYKLINSIELDEILDHYSFNGVTYSLPYLFFVDTPQDGTIDCFYGDNLACTISIETCYSINFDEVCKKIFGTTNLTHPGVKDFMGNEGKYCISGTISNFNSSLIDIPYISSAPKKQYVFQSRNPPHKAHENIISKYASSLLYTTPYETTKSSDYSFDLKIKTYEKIKELYNIDIFISLLPRVFAGPREALQNVLLFKNMGCTHFIMGRGKNCVGEFYGPTESYDFCKQFFNDIIYESTQYVNGEELKASNIKPEYIDKGIYPPEDLMSSYISEILLNG